MICIGEQVVVLYFDNGFRRCSNIDSTQLQTFCNQTGLAYPPYDGTEAQTLPQSSLKTGKTETGAADSSVAPSGSFTSKTLLDYIYAVLHSSAYCRRYAEFLKTTCIRKVPAAAWQFYIGGYQPAQKWLKDRKGQTLTAADIEHYQKIILALTRTAELMQQIDEAAQPM